MRMLSKLLESEAGQLSGSHCLVEWQELGNPRSVVEKKRVIKWTAIGDACDVKVTEKSKAVVYKAKLLACGKLVLWFPTMAVVILSTCRKQERDD